MRRYDEVKGAGTRIFPDGQIKQRAGRLCLFHQLANDVAAVLLLSMDNSCAD
jgi:hypothetical protein